MPARKKSRCGIAPSGPPNPQHARPAFCSLHRASLVSVEDSSAVRSGHSVALGDLAGFQFFDPSWASASRWFAGCDSLDLTFHFSFVVTTLLFVNCCYGADCRVTVTGAWIGWTVG